MLQAVTQGLPIWFDTTTGNQLTKLIASDLAPDDLFGISVAIDGPWAVVGSRRLDAPRWNSGSAYVFDVASGLELRKLIAADSIEGDGFGQVVAISGNLAIVGAPGHESADGTAGAAYVFDVTTGTQIFKLTAGPAVEEQGFGSNVAIDGNRAIVGGGTKWDSAGAAFVFDLTSGEQLFQLSPLDKGPRQFFGGGVAIEGDLAIVGATGDRREIGGAYVFDVRTGEQLRKITASDLFNTWPYEFNDRFGEFIDIDGNKAVVGVRLSDDHGRSSGSAYLFIPEPSSLLLALSGTSFLVPRGHGRGQINRQGRRSDFCRKVAATL